MTHEGIIERHPGRLRLAAAALAALFAFAALPGRALAAGDEDGHGEESNEASVLVMQGIALIVNQAEKDRVVERIEDALMAPDKEGVDLAKVEDALTAAESASDSEGLNQARVLLQESIGARPASGYGEVPRIGGVSKGGSPFATGGEPGTSVILDEVRPARGISNGGDAVLLVLAVPGLLLGLHLSFRFRPAHSIHQMRQQQARAGGAT